MTNGAGRRLDPVRSVWCSSDVRAAGRERRLPDGDVVILVNLAGETFSWFDGPHLDRRHTVPGVAVSAPRMVPIGLDRVDQRHVIGVELDAGWAAAVLGVPIDALTDPVVGLDQCWGRSARRLREQVLDAVSRRGGLAAGLELIVDEVRRRAQRPPDAGLVRVLTGLERGVPVRTVVDSTGLSASTLVRRVRAEVGLTPKQVQRLARLGRVLDRPSVDEGWASIAAAEHYADQSHLIREFRDLTGLTPQQYRSSVLPGSRHVPLSDPPGDDSVQSGRCRRGAPSST